MREVLLKVKNYFIDCLNVDEATAEAELEAIARHHDKWLSHPNPFVRVLAYIF